MACQPVRMNAEDEVVVAEGVAPNGDTWAVMYRPEGEGGRHHMALFVNGGIRVDGSGWDIPGTTEIGFNSGLKPGSGQFYLFGIVTSRIKTVRAESHEAQDWSEVATSALPGVTTDDGSALRTFVLVRPPVDNVTALVGVDRDGRVVQRISFPGPLVMSEVWAPLHLLEVVEARVRTGPDGEKTPMRALLDGTDIVVTFHWRDDPQLYGVRFATTEAPEGPSTGEVCETAEEWAQEVALVLMEELDTGLVTRGRRVVSPSGVVELDYRHVALPRP